MLCREGYDDHVAGHITFAQPDGTILVNPGRMTWDEVRASDVLRIDSNGNLLEGAGVVTPAIALHVELHRSRRDVAVAIHNHPEFGTAWANARRVPPIYDQSSSHTLGTILCDEYSGTFVDEANAIRAVQLIGSANSVLLANHGVLVLAPSIILGYLRASYLERCCRMAARVEALGGNTALDPTIAAAVGSRYQNRPMPELWEAMCRRELRRDPDVLE
jgi:L-fuculose-phosphate aldolase